MPDCDKVELSKFINLRCTLATLQDASLLNGVTELGGKVIQVNAVYSAANSMVILLASSRLGVYDSQVLRVEEYVLELSPTHVRCSWRCLHWWYALALLTLHDVCSSPYDLFVMWEVWSTCLMSCRWVPVKESRYHPTGGMPCAT